MNETQIRETSVFDDTSHPEVTVAENRQYSATVFMHPNEVVSDLRLSQAEKREMLASWASDFRAVPNAPALRQLDNGAVVRIDDVLQALNSLNNDAACGRTAFNPFRPYAGLRSRLSRRLKSSLGRDWPDDDDPPPCPATVGKPLGGPLSGEGAIDLSLVLAV